MPPVSYPYLVIGGGFYGCAIAAFLADGGAAVVLLEAGDELLGRASYINQARLHGGYHYPRSFSTAYRSRLNFGRFINEYRPAIFDRFTMLYAVARWRTYVSARQFRAFCRNIEAPISDARPELAALFDPRLIEAVFETEEYAFSARELRRLLSDRLAQGGVRVMMRQRAVSITSESTRVIVTTEEGQCIPASRVFNCTYSGLNRIAGTGGTRPRLKHEIAEMVIVEPPPQLAGIGVTVIDGPFFSFMPFPDRELYSFSHVRYTPHAQITEVNNVEVDPYQALDDYPKETRFAAMRRDAMRYIEGVEGFTYRDSLFECKTVMVKNEGDDGRPILLNVSNDPRIISILGSKIDNIYDAIAAIESHLLENAA